LQLAAISLRGRDDRSTFVAEFAGDDRFVVDYLADEVLDRQPADIRSFLLETSILTRLSAELCAAVTGRSEAGAILQSLERSNMFLVALDDRRHWYRYHHLFADVVRARLAHERADAVPELHRRASAWYEAHADDAEAVAHAMAAGDFVRAAQLIELAAPELRRRRQEKTLRQWLEALPSDRFTDRPVLAISLVGAAWRPEIPPGSSRCSTRWRRRSGPRHHRSASTSTSSPVCPPTSSDTEQRSPCSRVTSMPRSPTRPQPSVWSHRPTSFGAAAHRHSWPSRTGSG
jgi:LuxR family maltose regulon positive regulatory protein